MYELTFQDPSVSPFYRRYPPREIWNLFVDPMPVIAAMQSVREEIFNPFAAGQYVVFQTVVMKLVQQRDAMEVVAFRVMDAAARARYHAAFCSQLGIPLQRVHNSAGLVIPQDLLDIWTDWYLDREPIPINP